MCTATEIAPSLAVAGYLMQEVLAGRCSREAACLMTRRWVEEDRIEDGAAADAILALHGCDMRRRPDGEYGHGGAGEYVLSWQELAASFAPYLRQIAQNELAWRTRSQPSIPARQGESSVQYRSPLARALVRTIDVKRQRWRREVEIAKEAFELVPSWVDFVVSTEAATAQAFVEGGPILLRDFPREEALSVLDRVRSLPGSSLSLWCVGELALNPALEFDDFASRLTSLNGAVTDYLVLGAATSSGPEHLDELARLVFEPHLRDSAEILVDQIDRLGMTDASFWARVAATPEFHRVLTEMGHH